MLCSTKLVDSSTILQGIPYYNRVHLVRNGNNTFFRINTHPPFTLPWSCYIFKLEIICARLVLLEFNYFVFSFLMSCVRTFMKCCIA